MGVFIVYSDWRNGDLCYNKDMEIKTENELIEYGKRLADDLKIPAVIELVGDVGAGKTTLTRGIAEGLGISEPVTSPSFTISKRYGFKKDDKDCILVHYDFYRLPDPGIMYEEIAETLSEPNTVVIVEWGESIADLLPENRIKIEIRIKDDGSRECLNKQL